MSSTSSFSKTDANKKVPEASTSVSVGTGAIRKTTSIVNKVKRKEATSNDPYALRSRVKINGDVSSGTLGLDSVKKLKVVRTVKPKVKVAIPSKPPKPARSLFVPDQPKVNVTVKPKVKVAIPSKPPKPARSLFVPDQPKVNVTVKPKVKVEIPPKPPIPDRSLKSKENVTAKVEIPSPKPVPESKRVPKEEKLKVYKCPICWNDPPLEPTTTKCGHIFCHSCIDKTLTHAVQIGQFGPGLRFWEGIIRIGYCPICKEPIHSKDLIRVYLH